MTTKKHLGSRLSAVLIAFALVIGVFGTTAQPQQASATGSACAWDVYIVYSSTVYHQLQTGYDVSCNPGSAISIRLSLYQQVDFAPDIRLDSGSIYWASDGIGIVLAYSHCYGIHTSPTYYAIYTVTDLAGNSLGQGRIYKTINRQCVPLAVTG